MQQPRSHRGPVLLPLLVVLTTLFLVTGCAQRVYRPDNLPREMMAPAAVDPQCINLSGLADQSVSVEVIEPEDVLDVTLITDYTKLTTTTTPVRVGDDGSITIPLVGRVFVGGMEVKQAEQVVNAESIARGVFRTPCITVTTKQCHTSRVTVLGAVNSPGVRELPRGSTSLMAALLAAGGLDKEAGTDVEIHHTDSRQGPPEVLRVNLAAAAAGAVQVPGLRDGDVVQVAKRTLPPVYVIGLVTKPGEFPYPPNQELRVTDALALGGGVSNAFANDILVIRRLPNASEPVRIAVSIQDAKNGRDNIPLAPGDTVSVEQTPATAFLDVLQKIGNFGLGSHYPRVLNMAGNYRKNAVYRNSREAVGRLLLQLVDFSLAGVIFLVPLLMGGRHALGQLVLTVLAVAAAWAWSAHRWLECRRQVVGTLRVPAARAEQAARCLIPPALLLLLGTALLLVQIAPLPPWLLARLAPQVAAVLPLWRGGSAWPGPWTCISLAPAETLASLVIYLDYGLLFLVAVGRVRHVEDVERLLRWCALSAVIMAAFGIAQLLLSNGKFFWFYEHPLAETSDAAKGSFSNRNHFAHFLALGIGPLVWWLQDALRRSRRGILPRHSMMQRKRRKSPSQR